MLNHLSRVHFCATLWTVTRQAPPVGFSRQDWSGLLHPFTEGLPTQGLNSSLLSPSIVRQVLHGQCHMGSAIQTSTGKHIATSYTLTSNFVEQWKFSPLFWNKYTFLLINSLVTNCSLQNERESEQGNKQENKDTLLNWVTVTPSGQKIMSLLSFSWAGRSLWSLLEGPLCHQ